MTNYRRGVEIERKVQEILREAGYHALRTAGSHGAADIIGVGPTGVRLIQVKRSKDNNFAADVELAEAELRAMPSPPNTSKEIWVWKDREGWAERRVL